MSATTSPFWVHVHGPRAGDFEKVFGQTHVAVKVPHTHRAHLPGFDRPQEVYLLDIDWVTEHGHRDRLVAHLAERFGMDAADVDRRLDLEGMPILASEATLRIDNPQRWVG